MKPIELRMAPMVDLPLGDRTRLESIWSDLRDLSCIDGVAYFGIGDHRSRIRGINEIGRALSRRKSAIYTFADEPGAGGSTPGVYWEVEITPGLLSVLGILVRKTETLKAMADELPQLNRILVREKGQANVFLPISSINAPDVKASDSSIPKFGHFSPAAIVDVVLEEGSDDRAVGSVVERLTNATLPSGAKRRTTMDQVIVEWGDLDSEPPEAMLERRDEWFGAILGFENAMEPASATDTEFFINATKRAKGLTGYDESRQIGARAVVYTGAADVAPTLDELTRMLDSGATVEGLPLRDVVLIVPARSQAVELRKISGPRGLATVVYVGEDNSLYLPTTPR